MSRSAFADLNFILGFLEDVALKISGSRVGSRVMFLAMSSALCSFLPSFSRMSMFSMKVLISVEFMINLSILECRGIRKF